MKIKILVVFGTRPEAIKMAPLVLALKRANQFEVRVCVTGQHREMLDQVLELFEIKPDFDLKVMTARQSLSTLTGKIINAVSDILEHEFNPDIVLVHGDTTTSFAASMAAYYHKVKIGHVEAGLRSGNLYSPWPEEANRSLIGVLADLNFCPTTLSEKNLLADGVSKEKICITGNTVIDSLKLGLEKISNNQSKLDELDSQFSFLNPTKKIVLVTGHRRENFGEGVKEICKALQTLVEKRDDVQVVYPVHLNPMIKDPVNNLLGNIENIHLIKPLDYLPFIYLMKRSYLVLTDSGGIQEEAPALGKPVLVMRELTERLEALEAGTIKMVGTSSKYIVEAIDRLMDDESSYLEIANSKNPYGDGTASIKIINHLISYFK